MKDAGIIPATYISNYAQDLVNKKYLNIRNKS